MGTVWNWSPIPPEWADMASRLQRAEAEIAALSARLDALQSQLDEVKAKPPIHIEYQFDQLKVNRLDGTLNVGISPQGIDSLESLETPAPGVWQVKQEVDNPAETRTRELQRMMADYMEQTAPGLLAALAAEQGVVLEEDHRTEVLADVARQVKERVRYYAATSKYPEDGSDDEQAAWQYAVVDKTARDVAAAFRAYLSGMQATGSSAPPRRKEEGR